MPEPQFRLEWEDSNPGPNGVPYRVLVKKPMPGIPPHYRNVVVYLYGSEEAAQHGEPADGATGFLVVLPFSTPPIHHDRNHIYVVANAHTLFAADGRPLSAIWVRYWNARIPPMCVPFESWVFHEDPNNDVAVAFLETKGIGEIVAVPIVALDGGKLRHVGPGSDVFMITRLLQHDGGDENHPAVRFGTVAVMPHKQPVTLLSPERRRYQHSYLVEVRSIGGHSGSPIFVSSAAWNQIQLDGIWPQGAPLLGIDCGHLRARVEVEATTGEKCLVVQNTGMAIVLPSSAVLDTLHRAELQAARAAYEAAWDATHQYDQLTTGLDSAGPST